MMYNEKISIIVPAYNVENYIEKSVGSILNQTYKNIEVIIVDDGSKDTTPVIIDNLADGDSRVTVIHQVNGGVSRARFAGITAATGEWISFVDSDDFIEPEMLEMLMGNAITYNADISHCGYQMVFPSHIDYYYNTGKIIEQDRMKGMSDLLDGKYIEPGLWNKLYKKSLFNNIISEHKVDFSIKLNEDLLLNYYLFKNSDKSVFEDKCPYHYILRKGSAATSSINENKLKDPVNVLRIISDDIPLDSELKAIVEERLIQRLIYNSSIKYGKNKAIIKPYRKSARKELRQKCFSFLKGNYSKKIKFSVLWICTCPTSYNAVHMAYSKIKGTDKKYDIN